MKKVLLVISVIFCLFSLVSAQKVAEVSLRHSSQDNLLRIVIEAEEDIIRSANTITSASEIKIEFPVFFELKKPNDFILDIAKKDRVLTIPLKDAAEARSYKLASPSRIVVEVKIKPQGSSRQLPADTIKPQGQEQVRQKAETPILPERPVRFKTIVIDPGHGGYDYGIYRQEIKEKEVSLSIARDLANILQKRGLRVFLTRRADQALSLGERINMSNSKSPDLFISVHATSSDKFIITTAPYDETTTDAALKLYKLSARQNRHLDKSRSSAKAIADALKAEYKTDAISRELPLPVLTSMDAAAVFLEYPLTVQKTYDQKERDRLINTIVKGLAEHE